MLRKLRLRQKSSFLIRKKNVYFINLQWPITVLVMGNKINYALTDVQ